MLPVERHQCCLPLGCRCSDESIGKPHIMTFAVVPAVGPSLDRQASVKWDDPKRLEETLKTRPHTTLPPSPPR